jgi:hypothetical protein
MSLSPALERAIERLQQLGVVWLPALHHMDTARAAHEASGKFPPAVGWVFLDSHGSFFCSSYIENHKPQAIVKITMSALDHAGVEYNYDWRENALRLKEPAHLSPQRTDTDGHLGGKERA